MSDGLRPGAHVRHRRRPEWGIGVVTALERGDGRDDVVIAFEHAGEKKLRRDEGAFEAVPPDEVEAWQHARGAQKAAETKARRRLAAAVRGTTTTLSPVATVECGWGAIEAAGGGETVASIGGALRVYDPAGALLDELPTEQPPSDSLTVQGDFIVGRRTHDWADLLLCHRARRTTQLWRSPLEVGITRVAPAGEGEVLFWCRDILQLVDARGASRRVPFELAKGNSICSARAWGDALLIGTAGPDPHVRPYFHFACIERDGALRWRREGWGPRPLSASLLVAVDRGVVAVDAGGALVSHAPGPPPSDSVGDLGHAGPFVAAGDDVVFCAGQTVTRLRPSDGAILWSTELPALSSLDPPALAGGVVAASTGAYGEGKTVWLLDAASGLVLDAGEAPTKVSALCAVGPFALAACSYSKKIVAWRGLPSSPERLGLPHVDKVFDLCSPEPGALVARTGDHLTFWRL
ncbi:MAG TPA: DUF3553 domain-containing protein [Polyangiaceae bacterium]|nr:DUF3553 domain-containing protein [Polyangiaceae bacterium]